MAELIHYLKPGGDVHSHMGIGNPFSINLSMSNISSGLEDLVGIHLVTAPVKVGTASGLVIAHFTLTGTCTAAGIRLAAAVPASRST